MWQDMNIEYISGANFSRRRIFSWQKKLVIELALEVATKMRPPATKIKIKALLSLFFWPAFASATTKINLQKF